MLLDGANQFVTGLKWTNLTKMEIIDKEIIS